MWQSKVALLSYVLFCYHYAAIVVTSLFSTKKLACIKASFSFLGLWQMLLRPLRVWLHRDIVVCSCGSTLWFHYDHWLAKHKNVTKTVHLRVSQRAKSSEGISPNCVLLSSLLLIWSCSRMKHCLIDYLFDPLICFFLINPRSHPSFFSPPGDTILPVSRKHLQHSGK